MDLSKAFDTVNHHLPLVKFHAYRSRKQSLHIIYGYLSNQKQRIKISNAFSSWEILI